MSKHYAEQNEFEGVSKNTYGKNNKKYPAYDDNSLMPFGKYKDEQMSDVPEEYLIWLYGEGCKNTMIMNYIYNSFPELRR